MKTYTVLIFKTYYNEIYLIYPIKIARKQTRNNTAKYLNDDTINDNQYAHMLIGIVDFNLEQIERVRSRKERFSEVAPRKNHVLTALLNELILPTNDYNDEQRRRKTNN